MTYSKEGESFCSSGTHNSTPGWKYDVFLSFAGKDTRLKFVDHLDEAFNRSGIKTFKDEVDLERGGIIKQDLFQAIHDSLCAVPIISENYANSTWCLDELQMILESGRRVFPIFYDVDPADVRHQRKRFGEALVEHEQKFIGNMTKVQNWRNALFEIANLSGWDTRGKHEANLIKNVVGEIWTYLSCKLPSYVDNLVGIDSRVVDMMSILEIGLKDKRYVGIWGMGGLGKTTLARVVSEKISDKFEVFCFLAKVRETLLQSEGLVFMQNRLLSDLQTKKIFDEYEGMRMIRKILCNKKVLLVLDDLDDMSQLKNLAESPNWFGEGSRIIITTRYRHALTSSRVDEQRIYEMRTMEKDESLQLFSNKAFNKDYPEENYLKLSKSVVEYAGGLPLALEVLGSFLCGKSETEWEDALKRLKKIPSNDLILQTLKISYDGLTNEKEKAIFLDIACFFKGRQKKEVIQILESCDLNPTIGIKVLIEKALLVETKDCKLEMHDLLEDLGRYIVYQESPNDVFKRSRLWQFEDIKEVLETNKGSDSIQAIVWQGYSMNRIEVHPEAFLKMSNIRLLFIDHKFILTIILPKGLKLSNAIKVFRWPWFRFEALPLPLDKLVYIDMPCSDLKQLENDNQFLKKLKFINLNGSLLFTETPDFSRVPNLQILNLSCCTSLVKIHHSLGELKQLVEVKLCCCFNLVDLQTKLETNSLINLDLRECKKVAKLPKFGEGMTRLSYLDVSDTSITALPQSLGSLTGLRYLNLSRCKIVDLDNLLKTHITPQISGLDVKSLTELYLNNCGLNDGSIPHDFGSLSSLIVLDLSENDFVSLAPDCFSSLSRLVFLSLDRCRRLKSLPGLPPRLIRLNVFGCNSMEPLSSDREFWNLVASLDHEYRRRTKYIISYEKYDVIHLECKHVESAECLHLRDFRAIIQGHEIPSWFLNKEYFHLNTSNRGEFVIKVNIPEDLCHSEWSRIVVCFHISNLVRSRSGEWAALYDLGDDSQNRHLCIMVLELNEETCLQHIRAHNNLLQIKLSFGHYISRDLPPKKVGCGWRVICKEEIQENCSLNHFKKLIRPPLASHFKKLKLIPTRILDHFGRLTDTLQVQEYRLL